jgi:NAD+ dependent glucose-6-phosphate dehydrogenase
MRVLITGAGGNLGTKLHHHLRGRYDLVLTSRSGRPNTDIQAADLTDWDEAWVRLFRGVDVVVHLAANADPASAWSQLVAPNIDMVLNVCEACVANNVGRVVFASSNHVLSGYRQYDLPPMLRGDTPPNPGNPYGASKLFAERIGKSFSERHALAWIAVRIGMNRANYNNAPGPHMDDWSRKMWLSDGDYCQLMECCINAVQVPRWTTVNGVSNNTGTRWDLNEARALVGYQPQDNAFDTCRE